MDKLASAEENVLLEAASEPAGGLPPVIVLNLFHSGLGIVRQLSGRGIRVVGLSAHPRVYGNYTRLCEVCFAPDSQDQPEELVAFLLCAALHLRGAVIFPTRDADVLGLLVFLQHFALYRDNRRRRGRAFLDALREFHPPEPESPGSSPSSVILR